MAQLVAPAAKVLLYLEWLAVRGRELTLRPLAEPVQLIRARQDHVEWHQTTTRALGRAFSGDDLQARLDRAGRDGIPFDTGHRREVARFRTQVTGELAVLEEAILAVRAALVEDDGARPG